MDWYTTLKNDMNNHALRDYPREAVGIILKDFTYVPCKNLSTAPTYSFVLDPVAFITYDNNIWGIFHSHPGADKPIPSKDDKVSAAFQEYKLGSLEKGKWADFILIDRDYFTVPENEIFKIGVEQTWIAGEKRFEKK